MALGFCALRNHDPALALDRYQKAEELARQLLAPATEEGALGSQGFAYAEIGEFEKGREKSQQAVDIARALGRTEDEAKWELDLGRAYQNTARTALALEHYKQARTLAHKLGFVETEFRVLHNLVRIQLVKRQLAEARKGGTDSARDR